MEMQPATVNLSCTGSHHNFKRNDQMFKNNTNDAIPCQSSVHILTMTWLLKQCHQLCYRATETKRCHRSLASAFICICGFYFAIRNKNWHSQLVMFGRHDHEFQRRQTSAEMFFLPSSPPPDYLCQVSQLTGHTLEVIHSLFYTVAHGQKKLLRMLRWGVSQHDQ